MKIIKRRVHQPDSYISSIPLGQNFYIALTNLPAFVNKLQSIGFNPNINVGEQLLPSMSGTITKFNANGGFVIHRNQPKVTVYRQAVIKDWHGNHHTVDIPYKRFPRTPIPPPSIELLIRLDGNNNAILTSPILTNDVQSQGLIKHVINLFLEIFGECDVYKDTLLPSFNAPVTRLNWDILPAGNYPWATLQPAVQGIISSTNSQNKTIVQLRIQKISSYNPDFVGIGRAGFHGYIIFGFSIKGIYVLESIYTGNATYVLGQNWQQISQFTKEQILNQNLHQQRLIHTTGWDIQIDNLLT